MCSETPFQKLQGFAEKGFSKFPGVSTGLVRSDWFHFFICLRQVGGDRTPDLWSRFELQETLITPIVTDMFASTKG